MRRLVEAKIRNHLDPADLFRRGFGRMGQVFQKDTYLAGLSGSVRIREEGEHWIVTTRARVFDQRARTMDLDDRTIDQTEYQRLIRQHGIRAVVSKCRTLFQRGSVVIALDNVEQLGDFTEFRCQSQEELAAILEELGIRGEFFRENYFEMMLGRNLPRYLQVILRFHDRVGELAFGITSGILTALGVLATVNGATAATLAVIAAIAGIAVGDSSSDAFGMYMSKISERGASQRTAMRYALATLAGKCLFPFTFILPMIFLPLHLAVWVDYAWGAVALSLLSTEQALVAQDSIVRKIGCNLGVAMLIVLLSTGVGELIARLATTL